MPMQPQQLSRPQHELVYGVAILAALLIVPWLYFDRDPSLFRPGIAGDIVFSIAASFVFVSLMSVAQLIGPNILGSLLAGRYYQPREEQRTYCAASRSTSNSSRLSVAR